jgi:hypothetical protein
MALPKINDLPSYTLTVPSTNKKIKYRPFLTREQKVLLIALETQDQEKILNAIVDIISACIIDNIDINALTTFDVEYIFTQIRAKSVGEKSKVGLICVNCDHVNEVTVDLEKIKVSLPDKPNNVVKLSDVYTLKLKYPNYKAMTNNKVIVAQNSYTGVLIELAINCLDCLMSEEENITFADEPRAEVESFLDNLTAVQFEKIVSFVSNLPALEHKLNFDCESCGHKNNSILKGINDFF